MLKTTKFKKKKKKKKKIKKCQNQKKGNLILK